MRPELQNAFEQIAERAIADAEKLSCDFADYALGMKLILDRIQEHQSLVQEEALQKAMSRA